MERTNAFLCEQASSSGAIQVEAVPCRMNRRCSRLGQWIFAWYLSERIESSILRISRVMNSKSKSSWRPGEHSRSLLLSAADTSLIATRHRAAVRQCASSGSLSIHPWGHAAAASATSRRASLPARCSFCMSAKCCESQRRRRSMLFAQWRSDPAGSCTVVCSSALIFSSS